MFDDLAVRMIRMLPPEEAHAFTLMALKTQMAGRDGKPNDPILKTRLWDMGFANPLGLAAGFDKNAEVMGPMLKLGLGFSEIGTITPEPQDGNPRPRIFRWTEGEAVVNRMGFNNKGLEYAAGKMLSWNRTPGRPRGIVGVNIGKNKLTENAADDYVKGIARMAPLADYLAINVSSPNTPGLRDLQKGDVLEPLLQACLASLADTVRGHGCRRPPLLLKIAPDLSDAELEDIVRTVTETEVQGRKIDGMVVSNTTLMRPDGMPSNLKGEAGGLSGRPMFEMSTEILRKTAKLLKGRMPIIGVGGVMTGEDAYKKVRAGASLVQVYTGMIYAGTPMIRRIKDDLAQCLRRDGFAHISEAIGVDSWR